MEELKTSHNNKVNKKWIYITNFVFMILTYGMFLKKHFSLDTYSVYYYMDPGIHLKQSRFLNYLIVKLFEKININTVVYQQIFTMFFLVVLTWATVKLSTIIYYSIKSRKYYTWLLVNICVLISFVNVFVLEWFLYPEITLFYALSILSIILAIDVITKEKRWINLILSFLLLCISLNFYQGSMPFYVIYGLLIILLKNDFTLSKNSLIHSIKIIFIAFMGCVNTLLLQKIAIAFNITPGGDRDASFTIGTILNNIKEVLNLQKSIWYNTYGFLPKYMLMIVFLILMILLVYQFLKNKKIKEIIYIFGVLFVSYSTVFAPHFVTESLWFAPRTIVAYWGIITIIGLSILFYTTTKYIDIILSSTLTLLLIFNCISIQNIGVNHFATNKLDQEYAILIQTKINEYEEKTGIDVNYIAAICDTDPVYRYPGVDYTICDTNVRAYTISWADVNLINYYNSKNYEKVVMDQYIYEMYFKDRNWDYFNPEEQLIFINDTLNIVFY